MHNSTAVRHKVCPRKKSCCSLRRKLAVQTVSYLANRLPPDECATSEDQADAQPQDAVYKEVLYATV